MPDDQPPPRRPEPPARVGVIWDDDSNTIWWLGFGDYSEKAVPPEGTGGEVAALARRLGRPMARIELDQGGVIWGCEAFWHSADRIRQLLNETNRSVKRVELDSLPLNRPDEG